MVQLRPCNASIRAAHIRNAYGHSAGSHAQVTFRLTLSSACAYCPILTSNVSTMTLRHYMTLLHHISTMTLRHNERDKLVSHRCQHANQHSTGTTHFLVSRSVAEHTVCRAIKLLLACHARVCGAI